jgi:hypothetical protein
LSAVAARNVKTGEAKESSEERHAHQRDGTR